MKRGILEAFDVSVRRLYEGANTIIVDSELSQEFEVKLEIDQRLKSGSIPN